MAAKEKEKFEDMTKVDKEREMKIYTPLKTETKTKFKNPNAPEGQLRPSPFSGLSII